MDLSAMALAAGALGTASFGIVEGLKWTRLGEAGFDRITGFLGKELLGALERAYGKEYEDLLRAQYRQDSVHQTGIAKTLRQGVRIGLGIDNAAAIANYLGSVKPDALVGATELVMAGKELDHDNRGAIGRFELAVDARIDSALSKAQDVYIGTVRVAASIIAIGISIIAELTGTVSGVTIGQAILVGIAAVPLAPIANDVASALQAATKAMRTR